ncbi:DNA-3-methyladenine glycosylase [compost metagenome]
MVPDYATALDMDDEALIESLTSLRGVGRWTVEMLLIYSLERMDILPADDFGVREGYRRLKGLDVQPTRKQIMTIGLAWQPYRTVAAWYLWRVPGR